MRALVLLRTTAVAALLAGAGTASAQTQTYTSSPNLAIPDNDPSGTTDVINVTGSAAPSDVNIGLDITHTWVGDLIVTVTHPLGPVATLLDRAGDGGAGGVGCQGDNVNATFDDDSGSPAEDSCDDTSGLNAGPYTPFSPFSVFDNANPQGNWTIFLSDNAGLDTGTLNTWSITTDGVPVELTSFTGVANGRSADLAWATSSETNNAGFEVQTLRGTEWAALGFVTGHGTTAEAQSYVFRAENLAVGTHTFRLRQVDYDGTVAYHGDVEVSLETPGTHVLSAAYPNPFNPSTSFTLAVAQEQEVSVEVFNSLGQRVAVAFDGTMEANASRTLSINGAGLASGLYVVRVTGETFAQSLRVSLVK